MVQRDLLRNFKKDYVVEMFCKNPVFNGVYIEYFDNNNNILKSYPDFIFRVKNSKTNETIHDFYIEIKSDIDINDNKTTLIKNAYKNYIVSLSDKNDFIIKKNITLLILKIKTYIDINKTPDFEYIGFSTIPKIKEQLNSKDFNNKRNVKGIDFLNNFFKLSVEKLIQLDIVKEDY